MEEREIIECPKLMLYNGKWGTFVQSSRILWASPGGRLDIPKWKDILEKESKQRRAFETAATCLSCKTHK